MRRYWDLSDRERSELSSDDVNSMLDVELMEKGVTRVEEPKLLPTDKVTAPSTIMYAIKQRWQSAPFAYRSAEDAAEAMQKAVPLSTEYIGGTNWHHTGGRDELVIDPIEVYTQGDVANCRKAAELVAENAKANKQAQDAYDTACKTVTEACEGVWSDWHRCVAQRQVLQRVLRTNREYLALCDGNSETAGKFLVKAFPAETIQLAAKWYGSLVLEATE